MIPKSFLASRLAALVLVFPLSLLFFYWTLKKAVFLFKGMNTPSMDEFASYLWDSPLLLVLLGFCLMIHAFYFLFSWGHMRSLLFVWKLRWADLVDTLGRFFGLLFLAYWLAFPLWSGHFFPIDPSAAFLIHAMGLTATTLYLPYGAWKSFIRFGVLQGAKIRRQAGVVCFVLFLASAGVHGYDLLTHDSSIGSSLQNIINFLPDRYGPDLLK